MSSTPSAPEEKQLLVDPLMAELQRRVRVKLRERLRRRGSDRFGDQEIFDEVEKVFRQALETPADALLLPQMADEPDAWRLETALRFRSHRRWVGSILVGFKRRVMLPVLRWLFDYSRDNFERQQALNTRLLACIQAIAAEQAALRREIERLKARDAAPGRDRTS